MTEENIKNTEDTKAVTASQSAELFRGLAELAQVGIYITDSTGNYQYANPYWLGMAGLNLKDALGQGWIKSVHPEDRNIVSSSWDKAMDEGKEWRAEYRFQKPDGGILWVYGIADPQRDVAGVVVRYAGLVIDITKRKDAEEKLRTSEKILRNSQRVAGLGSYVMDIKTGQWAGSEVLDQVLGVDAGHEHSTAEWVALLHPDDRSKTKDYLDIEVIERAQSFDKEYRIVRPNDKEVRWVHGLGKLDLDTNGHPTKMYGTIQDITERKREDEVLRTKFEEVERLNDLMMGRELRMAELKKEIAELKEKLAAK